MLGKLHAKERERRKTECIFGKIVEFRVYTRNQLGGDTFYVFLPPESKTVDRIWGSLVFSKILS